MPHDLVFRSPAVTPIGGRSCKPEPMRRDGHGKDERVTLKWHLDEQLSSSSGGLSGEGEEETKAA